MQVDCPIWGTKLRSIEHDGDWKTCNSPRAGGKFRITGTAIAAVRELSGREKALLSYEILRENVEGRLFKIDSSVLRSVGEKGAPEFEERVNTLLRYIVQRTDHLGSLVQSQGYVCSIIGMSEKTDHDAAEIAKFMANHFLDEKLAQTFDVFLSGGFGAILAPKGWERAERLGYVNSKSEQIFVAMWFSGEMQEFYSRAVEPGIKKAGYRDLRIDNQEHADKIDDRIIAEIRRSRALLCDMTTETYLKEIVVDGKKRQAKHGAPRGGVFYEAGFAKGIGLPVIWTVKNEIAEVPNVVHFDVRQFNQIRWYPNQLDDARDRIANRIIAVLGEGPRIRE